VSLHWIKPVIELQLYLSGENFEISAFFTAAYNILLKRCLMFCPNNSCKLGRVKTTTQAPSQHSHREGFEMAQP